MKAGMKKIMLAAGMLLAGMGMMLAAVAVIRIAGLAVNTGALRDPDRRSAEERMAEYYGEQFTLISSEETERGIALCVLQDSSGAECRTACGQDYDAGRGIYRTYDDYRAALQARTPAVKRLLAQKEYAVCYETALGTETADTAFRGTYPFSGWVITVADYDALAGAVQLAAETVNAADSRLPHTDFWRSEYWGSLAPVILIQDAQYHRELARLPFTEQGTESGSDPETVLRQAQENWRSLPDHRESAAARTSKS